jgi:hypothetical protein
MKHQKLSPDQKQAIRQQAQKERQELRREARAWKEMLRRHFAALVPCLVFMVLVSCSNGKDISRHKWHPIQQYWCKDVKAGAQVTTITGMRNTDRITVLHEGCKCADIK